MQLPLLGHTMTSLTKFLTFALLLQRQAKYRQRGKPFDNVVIIYLTISELQPVSVGHQKSRLDRRRRNSRYLFFAYPVEWEIIPANFRRELEFDHFGYWISSHLRMKKTMSN